MIDLHKIQIRCLNGDPTTAEVMRNFDLDDPMSWLLSFLFLLFVIGGLSVIADVTIFERQAFAAISSCHAHRMGHTRKFLSTQTVCVPAYRETKNDTVTVNGLSRVTP